MNKSYPNLLTIRKANAAAKPKTVLKPDTAQKVDEELFLTTPTVTLPLGVSAQKNTVKIPMSPKKPVNQKVTTPKKGTH